MAVSETEVRIPFATLLKIGLTGLLALAIIKLWSVILMLTFAVLVAVMLDPIVVWLESHGARRTAGITLIAVVMFAAVLMFSVYVVPAMSRQTLEFVTDLPKIEQQIAKAFPPIAPLINQEAAAPQTKGLMGKGLTFGLYAVEGLTIFIFVLVVSIYLLVEGRRAYAWLVSFAPAEKRPRFDRTAREMHGVVLAYMRGNFMTSAICALFVFTVMSAMRVPVPLLLAAVAFVADFVPVVGTIVMTVPAALLAMTISPGRALSVVGAYLFYHLLENYVIIPRVYGSQMRLSTLTVLVSIAIGGALQGIVGAVLALPVAAAYPIIERIWLREHLPEDTVKRHEVIEHSPPK